MKTKYFKQLLELGPVLKSTLILNFPFFSIYQKQEKLVVQQFQECICDSVKQKKKSILESQKAISFKNVNKLSPVPTKNLQVGSAKIILHLQQQ